MCLKGKKKTMETNRYCNERGNETESLDGYKIETVKKKRAGERNRYSLERCDTGMVKKTLAGNERVLLGKLGLEGTEKVKGKTWMTFKSIEQGQIG